MASLQPRRVMRSLFTAGIVTALVTLNVGIAGARQQAPAAAPGAAPEREPESGGGKSATAGQDDRTGASEPVRFNLSADGGRGLIRAASPEVLGPGEPAAGFAVLNYDRNPGDIDFFQYTFQAAVGLPHRIELFLVGTPVLRTNSVNLDPIGFPIPPLDLFVDTYPTLARRPQPYFLFAQEAPFKTYDVRTTRIDPPGHGAFGQSSGDVVIGGKIELLAEKRGHRVGLGLRGYVALPTVHAGSGARDLAAIGSSGRTDVGVDLLMARRLGHVELLLNAGLKHVGDPDVGLRVQRVDSSKWGTPAFLVGTPEAVPLDLHDQLILNGGTSFPAFSIRGLQFWGIGEAGYIRYVGSGTPVERLVHPFEIRLGIQANVPKFDRVAIGAAWELLINDGGNGTARQTTFRTPDGRGDINFDERVDPALAAQLTSLFAAQGATLTPGSSRLFATNNPAFDAWRNVEPGPTPVVSMGGGNILGFVTWRIR